MLFLHLKKLCQSGDAVSCYLSDVAIVSDSKFAITRGTEMLSDVMAGADGVGVGFYRLFPANLLCSGIHSALPKTRRCR